MAKKKKPEQIKETKEITVVQQSDVPALRLDPSDLAEYQKQRFTAEVPDLNDALFAAIKVKLANCDSKTMQMTAEMLGLVKASGGLSIQHNNLTQNLNVERGAAASFAGIVRKLQESRRSEQNDGIIEAEVVDE